MIIELNIPKHKAYREFWPTLKKLAKIPIMALYRFKEIRSSICCYNEDIYNGRPYTKVQPIVDHFNEIFSGKLKGHSSWAVDETLIKCHARNPLRVRMDRKPAREGTLFYTLASNVCRWADSIFLTKSCTENKISLNQIICDLMTKIDQVIIYYFY